MTDLRERLLEIFLYVVTQGLQRRDIEHLRVIVEFAAEGPVEEVIDAGEKRRERLAGTGRRGDQGIRSGLNRRPGLGLNIGRNADRGPKPFGNEGMKPGERHSGVIVPRRTGKLYLLWNRPDKDVSGRDQRS